MLKRLRDERGCCGLEPAIWWVLGAIFVVTLLAATDVFGPGGERVAKAHQQEMAYTTEMGYLVLRSDLAPGGKIYNANGEEIRAKEIRLSDPQGYKWYAIPVHKVGATFTVAKPVKEETLVVGQGVDYQGGGKFRL